MSNPTTQNPSIVEDEQTVFSNVLTVQEAVPATYGHHFRPSFNASSLPKFGGGECESLSKWLTEVTMELRNNDVPKERWHKYSLQFLTGTARDWLIDSVQKNKDVDPFDSWDALVTGLKSFYQEQIPMIVSMSELANLKCVDDSTIVEHIKSFNRLIRASNLFEAKNIPLFISVLFKESLPDKLHRIMSTQVMADLDHDLMKIQRRVSEETNHLHRSNQFARMQPTLAVAKARGVPRRTKRVCTFCKKTGHDIEDCWDRYPEKRPASWSKKDRSQ